MELLVPTVSDIIFKYTWTIANYKKAISKKHNFDSPSFDLNVNGIHSTWNLSIRFWKGPEGKRIRNPVVLCLNIQNCTVEEVEQAKVRFQFAVFNAEVNYWEYCHVSRTILELRSSSDIISLGYRDLCIVDRHLKKNGELSVMVKIQIIQCDSEKHTLSQDMARLLKHPQSADTKLIVADENLEIQVHKCVIAARSDVLANMITPLEGNELEEKDVLLDDLKKKSLIDECNSSDIKHKLELRDLSKDVIEELLRYMYTDHVDNLDTLASELLSLSLRFRLQGMKELCERSLTETITPENVATRLLLADEYGCDILRRASLAYCEENAMNITKNFAWKMMEQVNPELFNEVCEAGMGSSKSSNIDSE
ncbi:PREDICTED: TD and POZ domain-containing protein 2-like [Ceratosolen solmsi marchali]|uniref:TD and POZ domain-containing protein 2-like n=1 Tax=Ceratosolen solmsi marchali TaxID=326594 RepID=A0AAJ6YWY8_9HYME|nr:PREDICTED: TD and POZ domain-containing protein 2-like [Ceratosolen solmsi marchali]